MNVLSWGANSHGQLGQGTVSEQCATPQPVIQTWTGEVKEISGGGGHSLLINENGWIFACGWNHQRQLGFVDKSIENNHCHTFTRNWDLSGLTFIKICTGWDSSAAITEKNVLYLWGSNAYGQLGLPREHFPNALKPIQLELKGKTISMGMRHTILVDIHGCVWSTGCGKRGQLGLGDSILNSDTFKKIPDIKNIENAVCGQHHTLAWSKVDSVMYAWGDNSHGQLGCSTNVFDQVFFPIKVAILSNCLGDISSIYSGWTHSAVLLNNGSTIYWGRNNYGQLACDYNPEQSHNAPKIKDLAVQKLSLGSEHSVCLAADGSVWAWGWNEHANTGTGGTSDNVKEPQNVKINNNSIVNIFSGAGHNFIVHR